MVPFPNSRHFQRDFFQGPKAWTFKQTRRSEVEFFQSPKAWIFQKKISGQSQGKLFKLPRYSQSLKSRPQIILKFFLHCQGDFLKAQRR